MFSNITRLEDLNSKVIEVLKPGQPENSRSCQIFPYIHFRKVTFLNRDVLETPEDYPEDLLN